MKKTCIQKYNKSITYYNGIVVTIISVLLKIIFANWNKTEI